MRHRQSKVACEAGRTLPSPILSPRTIQRSQVHLPRSGSDWEERDSGSRWATRETGDPRSLGGISTPAPIRAQHSPSLEATRPFRWEESPPLVSSRGGVHLLLHCKPFLLG